MNWSRYKQHLDEEDIKWLLVDFDDTLAQNTGKPDYIPTVPVEGAKEWAKERVEKGYKIVIYTARPWTDYHNIERWLNDYEIPFRKIECGKVFGKAIIDDRAIRFNGDWNAVTKELERKDTLK